MLFKLSIVLTAIVASTMAQKLPIYVYYESLCPDSQAFFINQLYPTMTEQQLLKYVNLHLVPFGKSTFTTSGADVTFRCHHGPNECYGNKVQACALQHIQVDSFQNENTKDSLELHFIHCLMKTSNNFPDAIYPIRRCADEVKVKNPDIIEQCANSTEGSKLLQKMGEQTFTLDPPLSSVPTITVKQLYDSNTQALALRDLRSVICKSLTQPLPYECRAAGTATNLKISTGLLTFVGILSVLLKNF